MNQALVVATAVESAPVQQTAKVSAPLSAEQLQVVDEMIRKANPRWMKWAYGVGGAIIGAGAVFAYTRYGSNSSSV